MPGDTEASELSAAIIALEAQRPLLGDSVVDPAVAALREKLAAFEAPTVTDAQRKVATVLFADVSGFTAISETMDAEVVASVMNDLWMLVDRAITAHGGRIDKHIGDAVMALWGSDIAREDDAEQAIRGALAMQAAIDTFCKTHSVPLALRIGVNTGPVLLGRVGTTGEFTAIGDAVNVANRLEQAAPVGGILISHDTYRHVRGVFDVLPQEPLSVKGKVEAIRTYIVQQAKPRAFRMATRGVEGVETRTIGREAELLALQAAYSDAMEASETRVVTIVGEAGIGKSRLLYEFDNWLELQPERVYYFKGRTTPNLQNVPLSLIRDLFAFRFNILDGDSASQAIEKFRAGMDGFLEPEQADVTGHWLGFDFSASEAVYPLFGSPDFGTLARNYLTRYFRARCAAGPVVIFLEDIHWADEQSLELGAYLVSAIPAAQLQIIAVTRPILFERWPNWGKDLPSFKTVELQPLSRRSSRALVEEILRQVEEVTEALRELIVNTSEGNPFYVEELVKTMIEQGVIERTGDGAEFEASPKWRVHDERLARLEVPPTLMGLLQARLDGLPRQERAALQQAAVVGRLFWDDAVADLAQVPVHTIASTLAAACERELIFLRDRSSFSHTGEYVFKHSLLRDVAYETVLLKDRAAFHGRVARWLEAHAGDRLDEYLTLIAEHYAEARENVPAAQMLERAGVDAMNIGAFPLAQQTLSRAIALRDEAHADHGSEFVWACIGLGLVLIRLSDFPAAESVLERGLAGAREIDDVAAQAEALAGLAEVAAVRGEFARSQTIYDDAMPLARAAGGRALARVLGGLSSVRHRMGDLEGLEAYAGESLITARAVGDVDLELRALVGLGLAAYFKGNVDLASSRIAEGLELTRRSGNFSREAMLLNNLGSNAYESGDASLARTHYQGALDVARMLEEKASVALALINLAQANLMLGDLLAAQRDAREGLALAYGLGSMSWVLFGVQVMGEIAAAQGDKTRALTLFGLVRNHPALDYEGQVEVDDLVARLDWSADENAAGLAIGAGLDLDTTIAEILAKIPA